MSENVFFPTNFRENSICSVNALMHESRSASPRSSSPFTGWTIQYKPAKETKQKGAWGEFRTQEEFMAMHLR